jgi:hypothetical protein
MFSSSNGSKKPVQQVSPVVLVWEKTKADHSLFYAGDGSGWSVLSPTKGF